MSFTRGSTIDSAPSTLQLCIHCGPSVTCTARWSISTRQWRVRNRYTTAEMTAGYPLWVLHYLQQPTAWPDAAAAPAAPTASRCRDAMHAPTYRTATVGTVHHTPRGSPRTTPTKSGLKLDPPLDPLRPSRPPNPTCARLLRPPAGTHEQPARPPPGSRPPAGRAVGRPNTR